MFWRGLELEKAEAVSHFTQVFDGEWVTPIMRGWKQKCCECGLVHVFQFRVTRHGARNKIQFRAWRLPVRKKKR